ncbi:MAG: general secretion pathway protein GspB [Syntrophorhabdus sp.]
MSYILEALKKLERERHREKIPDLLARQEEAYPVKKRRLFWPYIIAGLVFLNAMFVFWLLWVDPRMNMVQPPKGQTRVATEKVAPAPQTLAEETREQPVIEDKKDAIPPEKKTVIPIVPRQPQAPLPKKITPEPSPPKTAAVEPPPPVQAKVEATPKTIKPTPPSAKITSIKELPADVRASLPEIKMTVHSYNDQAKSRFVVINNTIFREGQSISGDLKVVQITQKGVILNHQGHRFLLGINENP